MKRSLSITIRMLVLTSLASATVGLLCGCDSDKDRDRMRKRAQAGRHGPSDPRLAPQMLDLEDSFGVVGFTYAIDSVERSDVHARFEDEKTGEMDWVTIHYRIVNTSDEPMAPIIPDVIVETKGLTFRDTGGNAQIGDAAVAESGMSIGQLDELQPGETEQNMAIFKLPDRHADTFKATFDFDGYELPTRRALEYQFTLEPKLGTQVLREPDAGPGGDADETRPADVEEPTKSGG